MLPKEILILCCCPFLSEQHLALDSSNIPRFHRCVTRWYDDDDQWISLIDWLHSPIMGEQSPWKQRQLKMDKRNRQEIDGLIHADGKRHRKVFGHVLIWNPPSSSSYTFYWSPLSWFSAVSSVAVASVDSFYWHTNQKPIKNSIPS